MLGATGRGACAGRRRHQRDGARRARPSAHGREPTRWDAPGDDDRDQPRERRDRALETAAPASPTTTRSRPTRTTSRTRRPTDGDERRSPSPTTSRRGGRSRRGARAAEDHGTTPMGTPARDGRHHRVRRARLRAAAGRSCCERGKADQGPDTRDREAAAKALLESLRHFGIEARLLGVGQRPARQPLRAAARAGHEGLEDHPAQGRPRLRARLDRHPHPRPDPRQEGRRRRGPEPAPPHGPPRRHLRRPAEGRLAAGSSGSARTSPARPSGPTWR